MRRAVVFDLDGTLVDTPRAIVETIDRVLTDNGYGGTDPGKIRATIGTPLEAAFGGLMDVEATSEVVEEAMAAYRALFAEVVLPQAKDLLFGGVDEGLERLAEDNLALAVATSKLEATAEALLEAAGIRGHFEVVVGADQVSRPKPDPEMALLTLELLGCAPSECLVVGDTTHDLLMAKAAAIPAIGVTYGVHAPNVLRQAGPIRLADSFAQVVSFCTNVEEDVRVG